MSKKLDFQQDLKRRLEIDNTSRLQHTSFLRDSPQQTPDSRPSIPLNVTRGSIFSFRKHLKLFTTESFSLPTSPREEDIQISGTEKKNSFSKSLPQSPTDERIQDQTLDDENLRSFEEAVLDVNKITEKNPNANLTLVFSSENEKEEFKKFSIESLLLEQYEYYEMYQRYINEKNDEEKRKIEEELFDKFINPKSENSILFSQKATQRILKYYEKRNPISLQICYVNAFQQLERCYENFKKGKTTTQKVGSLPTNFKELTASKECFKLFCNYVAENFGSNVIQCYNDLLTYKNNADEKSTDEIINDYCKKESNKRCIFNPDLRNKILTEKGKLRDNWFNDFYDYIYKILADEYCPRFVNSNIWRDYINLNYVKEESLKFVDLYSIKSVDKRRSFFSEKYEIISVTNIMTSEIFKAKRVMSTKANIEIQSIKYLESQIQHENIIQLIEMFKEDCDSYDKETLSIVTTHFKQSLNDFIENMNEPLNDLELVDAMRQILSALQCFHKKKRYFELGQLNESNIYLSSLLINLYLDPGYYYTADDESEDYSYLRSPEAVSSPKSDIYAAGFIFFRLASGHSPKEIQTIFEKKEKKRGWLKNLTNYISSPASTSEFDSVDDFESGFTSDPRMLDSFSIVKGVTPDYIANMKDEFMMLKDTYDVRILNVMIQMIDEHPYRRPKIEDMLKELNFVYREIRRGTIRKMSNKYGSLSEIQKLVITNDVYRQYFKEFLRTEYAAETLLFFEDVKKFQSLTTDQERLSKANEICESYLKITSDLEINVSGNLKKNVSQDLKEATETGKIGLDIFDDMAKHVSDTILLDSFNRFEQSPIRVELQKKIDFDKSRSLNAKSTVKVVLK